MKKGIILFTVLVFGMVFPQSISHAYTVKPGDSLSKIASNHHMTINEILGLNPEIKEPNSIKTGQAINLKRYKLSNKERKLLAQLIHAEASGEPFDGKVKVAQVVFNRVKSSQFPNTIEEVITQDGQFSPVANGAIHNTPTDLDYEALNKALHEDPTDDGSLYFFNPEIAESQWLSSLETTTVIGHHVFKK